MTPNAPTTPVTMRSFLFGSSPGEDTAEVIGRTLNEHGVAHTGLLGVRHLSGSVVRSVDREVGTVLDGLLEQDLGDVLVSCWRKHRSLVEAAEHTLAVPGSEVVVALATHRATATYSPHVDLYVDDVKVNTFEFELEVVVEATGLAAVVRHGDLVALRGGDCLVTAVLTLEGGRLAERQHRFDAELLVELHRPVALIDKAAASTIPIQRQQPVSPDRALAGN